MMISRENIARLIEGAGPTEFTGALQANLGLMTQNIEQMLAALLTGVPPAEMKLDHSVNALTQQMQSTIDRFRSEADSVKNMFEPGEIKGIEDARTKIFPRIVEYNVAQLLKGRDSKDITLINSTLVQLREKGVAAVWDQILPSVTAHTHKICGQMFPREYIEEGKTQALDMAYLSSLVKTASAEVSSVPPAATAAEPRRAAPTNSYMGMRPGFLNQRPAKSEQNPKNESSEFRPK